VAGFVEAVASSEHAAPAAGSVAALTGASAAALLELAGGVSEHDVLAATRLRRELLALIDADAIAVREWLATPSRSEERRQAGQRAIAVPLEIARKCAEVAAVAAQTEGHVDAAVRADAGAARTLAAAAARTALTLVEANLPYAAERDALETEIQELRERIS
jgi:formiminotetrahydrofolate cyclodeaminase